MSCHCGCNNTTTPTSFSNVDISGSNIVSSNVIGCSLTGSAIAGLVVDTIADLKALVTSALPTDAVQVLGYYAAGDGGGGVFRFDSASVTTANLGTVFAPNVGSGRWLRVFSGVIDIRWFGADNAGVSDSLAAITSAITSAGSGRVLFFPAGTYVVSGTIPIAASHITIQGEGVASAKTTSINPTAGFVAGDPLFKVTSSYVAIREIFTDMELRGGSWVKLVGDGGEHHIERCTVHRVASGYWGIHGDDAAGANGIALCIIRGNVFYNFGTGAGGGAIFFDGGGDSNWIYENTFQLVNSGGHILKWNGNSGAANLDFSANNATGAAKFIQMNLSLGFKITKNQFEATTAITNASGSMIEVVGTTNGFLIADNNMDGHSNVTFAIYLNDAEGGYLINNRIIDVTTAVDVTVEAALNTFMPGIGVKTVVDPYLHLGIVDANGVSYFYGNFYQRAAAIINKITNAALNWYWGNTTGNQFGIYSDASGNTKNFIIAATTGNVGLKSDAPLSRLTVNGGVLVRADATAEAAVPDGAVRVAGISFGPDPNQIRIEGGGSAPFEFQVLNALNAITGVNLLRLKVGPGNAIWGSSIATPESAITAPVGSLWTNTGGGSGTVLYLKESGSGNTGWVAQP